MENGFKYIIQNNGICSEDDYPFEGRDGICTSCDSIVSIKSYGDITPNNEKVLKRARATGTLHCDSPTF